MTSTVRNHAETVAHSRPHLALTLPEIVTSILMCLAPSMALLEYTKRKPSAQLYACLFVNRLWHDCAARLLWRTVVFEDTKSEYDLLLKFASTFANEPISTPSLSSSLSTSAAMLAIATPNASFSSSITSLASVSSETSTSSSTLSTPSTSACVKCHPAPDKAPLPSRSLHRRFSHPNDSLSPRDYPTESNNNQTLKEHRKNVHLNKKLLSNQPSQNQLIVSGTEDMQPQLPLPPNHHLHFYRNSLRTLFVRKLKETSINEPLMQIGRHATKLKRLDVYICDHFTDRALYPFLAHKTLTYLSLAGCHRLTDVAVLRVSETCTMLEHLDLRACGLVSDVSISAIATRCPRLRHLNVGRIRDRHRITVRSITLIAKHTKATVLGLAGCDIDDECMRVLAHYRRAGLERVSVNNCQRLTNATIYSFIKYCPNLSVFEMKECHLINDWEAVAELVHRKVLLTLCDRQNRACTEWAQRRGRPVDVKAPLK